MNTINRIGFKHYDTIEERTELPIKIDTEVKNFEVPVSPAQADLLETINNLADMIVDKSFSKYTEEQKNNFVTRLINSVSLNAELNTQKNLLLA